MYITMDTKIRRYDMRARNESAAERVPPPGDAAAAIEHERDAMPTDSTYHHTNAESYRWGRANAAPWPRALAGLLAAVAMAMSAAPPAMLPVAKADPGPHTVVYRILGGGDVFSVIPDPGTPVYPASTTTWVSVPWSQTVQVSGTPYLALNYTDKTGGPHDCAIQVDGKPVKLTEHSAGRCAYQIPGPAQ